MVLPRKWSWNTLKCWIVHGFSTDFPWFFMSHGFSTSLCVNFLPRDGISGGGRFRLPWELSTWGHRQGDSNGTYTRLFNIAMEAHLTWQLKMIITQNILEPTRKHSIHRTVTRKFVEQLRNNFNFSIFWDSCMCFLQFQKKCESCSHTCRQFVVRLHLATLVAWFSGSTFLHSGMVPKSVGSYAWKTGRTVDQWTPAITCFIPPTSSHHLTIDNATKVAVAKL